MERHDGNTVCAYCGEPIVWGQRGMMDSPFRWYHHKEHSKDGKKHWTAGFRLFELCEGGRNTEAEPAQPQMAI